MGTYEDLAFTFVPSAESPEAVAADLRALLDRPLDDLPDGDWNPDAEPHRERDFERDALSVEVDGEYGQTYLYGRTHAPTCQEAWREWVVNGNVGDGALAIVLGHEVDYSGMAWGYHWNPDAERYRAAVSDPANGYVHVEGEAGGSGAIAAHRVRDALADEIRPARCRSGLVRWGEADRGDDDFIPDHYFASREDPPDPRDTSGDS